MDLALHFGMPAEALARRLTEREFVGWQHYAAKRMLPMRRLELHLAQIALLIASAFGGAQGKSLEDYLFDPLPETGDRDDLDAAIEHFDFRPVRRD